MHCRNCEANIAESAAFCGYCGVPTQQVASQKQSTTQRGEDRSNANISVASKSLRLSWRNRVPFIILFCLIGAGVAGYFYSANTHIDPAELSVTISSNLAENGIVGLSVKVSNDRMVTLVGEVEEKEIVETALGIADSTKGVKGALSQLTVLPSIEEVELSLSRSLKDKQLNDIVFSIDQQRIVTLAGSVSDEAMINVATNTVAVTPGLKGLISRIQIITPTVIAPPSTVSSQYRHELIPGNAPESNPRISPSANTQDYRTSIRSRDPVADRRWLRD